MTQTETREPFELSLPFTGRWLVQNSPARRVPSHGIDKWGLSHSIDFVNVDDRGRSAPRTWRSFLTTERPEGFVGFGVPILAPLTGTVARMHDGEADHEARRSPASLLGYALGQASRVRRGPNVIAGNHVIIRDDLGRGFVALVHLRRGSLRVAVGDRVNLGEQIGECGNSGNSTEPHVHLQAMDSADLRVAQGLPITFRRYHQWSRATSRPTCHEAGIPADGAIVAPLGQVAD